MRLFLRIVLVIAAAAIGERASLASDRSSEHGRQAAKSFRRGELAFSRRQFTTAGLAFERAGRLAPHPSPWLNASEAWERAGDPARAAENCDRVLEMHRIDERYRSEALKRLGRLEHKIATVDLRGSRLFRVRVDGGRRIQPPAKHHLIPGSHRLAWVFKGTPSRHGTLELVLAPTELRDVDLEALKIAADETSTASAAVSEIESDESDAELAENEGSIDEEPAAAGEAGDENLRAPFEDPDLLAEAAEIDRHDDEERGLNEAGGRGLGIPTASWIAFGIAGAATTAGAIFGGLTLGAKSDFDASPTSDAADRFFARRRAANTAWALAAVSASVGFIVWALDDEEETPRAAITLAPARDGAGVAASLSY